MEVGIRVETEYSRSYTEDIILDIDIIQIWKRRYFSRPLSVPFLFLYFVPSPKKNFFLLLSQYSLLNNLNYVSPFDRRHLKQLQEV